jgi:hypothetical protein
MIPWAIITTLHFLHNLGIGTISLSVFQQESLPALCNATLQLIGPICKFKRELSVVNTIPFAIITTLHFLHNFRMGTIS